MCKLHGVRLIKGIKIFESMLEKFTVTSYKTARSRISTFKCCSISTVCCGRYNNEKCRLSFVLK